MPLNNASNARNTQSKTVQPNKHKPSNLTVIESTSSSDEWLQQQKSKTKHTPPSTPNSPSTPSSRQHEIKKTKLFFSPNRYTVLSEKEDDITDNDTTNAPDINVPPAHETTQTNQTNKNKNNLPPPIFVKGTKKYSDLREAISDQIGPDSFICKSTTAHIKIQANTSDNYRTLIHFLQDQGAEYHTFQPQTDKSIRVVIKNIHYTTEPTEILEALEEIGFTVRQVVNIKHQQTKMPLPIFFVDLAPEAISKEIFNITSLLNTKIKVEEPHKRREIPQCQNCQSYGHTKGYCSHSPRCVKCGEHHLTSICSKSSDVPAKCALCNGSHPANYKGCAIYKELQQRRRFSPTSRHSNQHRQSTQSENQQTPPVNQQTPGPAAPASGTKLKYSYAEATATTGNAPPQNFTKTQHPVNIENLLTKFIDDFKCIINPLLSLLTTVISNLSNLLNAKHNN